VAWSEVFSRTPYIVGAATLAIIIFVLAVLLPNFALLNEVVLGSSASPEAKINLTLSLLGGIKTNFSTLSAIYTILIAILVGVNAAMVVYLMRKQNGLAKEGIATGVGGIASGTLGVGWAACGSFLLATILASVGAASAIAILPLKGGEFGIISVALLGITLGVLGNKIAKPLVCKPKNNHE